MKIGNTTTKEIESLTEAFVRQALEKLVPAVTDVVERKDSGKFEIHFSVGQLTRIRKDVTI